MTLPRVRFSVRRMMLAIAIATVFTHYVAMPLWNFYSLTPRTHG
jgi:hypothetical protein